MEFCRGGSDYKFGISWIKKYLIEADRNIAFEFPNERFEVYIVGGAALALLGVDSKMTDDIDVISVSDSKIKPILFENGYINQRVTCTSDSFSTEMYDRVQKIEIGETLAVDYMIISIKDIVASKLYAGRGKDKNDLYKEEVAKLLNWDILDKIVYEEMKIDSLSERRWKELVYEYETYKEVYCNGWKKT